VVPNEHFSDAPVQTWVAMRYQRNPGMIARTQSVPLRDSGVLRVPPGLASRWASAATTTRS
jgi:hypothetical protein